MYFQNFFINIYNLSSYDSHLMSHNILYYSFGSILTVIKTWKFHPTFGWVESTIWCINRERDVQSWKIVDMYSQKGFFPWFNQRVILLSDLVYLLDFSEYYNDYTT